MKLCGDNPYARHVPHLLLIAGIIFVQIYNQLQSGLTNLAAQLSIGALCATSLLALQHVCRIAILAMISTNSPDEDKEESDVTTVIRNFLGGAALVLEFAAFGLDKESASPVLVTDKLTRAALVLGGLCALRLLDMLLDFEYDFNETVAVQCVSGDARHRQASTVRIVVIHILLAVSLGLTSIHYFRSTLKDDYDDDATTADAVYHDWGLTTQGKGLAIGTSIVLLVHLVLHPLNLVFNMFEGLKEFLLNINACRCMSKDKSATNADCDGNGRSAAANTELVAINRLPLVRQLVATFILTGLAFVAGGTYGKTDVTSQYNIAALVAYSAYDVLGRNKL